MSTFMCPASRPQTVPAFTSLADVQWWASASRGERAAVRADMDACLSDGVPAAEYLQCLAEYQSAADFIRAAVVPLPTPVQTVVCPEPGPLATAATPMCNPQADVVLRDFAVCARSAAVATLRLGQLGLTYVRARMAESAAVTRSMCTEVLTDALYEHSDAPISRSRVNDLLALAATWELFAGEQQPGTVPVSVVRCFVVLVTRDCASRAERWFIAPAVAEAATRAWRETVDRKLTRDEAGTLVAKVRAGHRAAIAARAADVAEHTGLAEDVRKAAEARTQAVKAEQRLTHIGETYAPAPKQIPVSDPRSVGANGQPKDVAALVLDVFRGAACKGTADTVFGELLAALAAEGQFSSHVRRAAGEALAALRK